MTTRFIDLQVNGYAGVDFNGDQLDGDAMHRACAQMQADGVAGFLATIITDHLDVMANRLDCIARIRDADPLVRELVWGVHIEGPFINETPGYVGAHPADAARPADPPSMQRLLDAAAGLTRIVTLAPERDPGLQVTQQLARQGIRVAAGHCDPSVDELAAAIDAGLTMFTHLGNGCPMIMHRHDNIIQRVLKFSDRLWTSFIADGVHVPYVALGNYLNLAGLDRSIIVTDAISAAGLGPGRYTLGSQTVDIGEDLVPRAPDHSHFMGSAATMPRMVAGLKNHLQLSDDEIVRLTSVNPQRVLDN